MRLFVHALAAIFIICSVPNAWAQGPRVRDPESREFPGRIEANNEAEKWPRMRDPGEQADIGSRQVYQETRQLQRDRQLPRRWYMGVYPERAPLGSGLAQSPTVHLLTTKALKQVTTSWISTATSSVDIRGRIIR